MNPIFATEYLVLAVLLLTAAGGAMAWWTTTKCRRPLRIVITAMRVLGVLAVCAIAFNFGRWQTLREDRRSEWAILLDRSGSMGTPDVAGRTRWHEAGRILDRALTLSGDTAGVRVYTFGDQLEPVMPSGVKSLKPEGPSTDILRAAMMAMGLSRSAGHTLKGMVVLSDGRQIEPGSLEELGVRAQAQESPVYTLTLGGPVPVKDISLTVSRRHFVAFAGHKVRVSATVQGAGLGMISPQVELVDAKGAVVGARKVNLPDGGKVPVQFELQPAARGTYEYVLRVPVWPDEDRPANNEAAVSLTVLDDKMRVLVVEGVPFWDSKFLIQLLRKQANTEVTSIYRLSSDRFFKVETDPSKAAESQESIFPDDRKAIDACDVIVLGRGMEYFLTPDRVALLRAFVKERGGALVFARGKPYSGLLPELESLEPVEWGGPLELKYSVRPTAAGEDAGLFGDALPGGADPLWGRLPALQNAQRVAKLKSFANVLVEGVGTAGDKESTFPVVVSRRFGKGLIVTVNAEGLWQWDFFPSNTDATRVYKEFWAQLVQWAMTFSEFLPGQDYSLRLSQDAVLPGVPVRARINRRLAVEKNAERPVLTVSRAGAAKQEFATGRDPDADNGWDIVFTPSESGLYTLELTGTASGKGPRQVLTVLPRPKETDTASADPEFMGKMAALSGGRAIAESDLPEVIKTLETETQTVDLNKAIWSSGWDRWWFLLIAAAFFAIEWFLRRRNGLL